jgi:hypothetical protein
VLPGELVFRHEENADYSSLPRGVGSFAVIRHQDDVLSVYCHLRRDLARPALTTFTVRDPVGVTGDTGASEGTHLHFSVYDGQTGSWVNPLSLLPPVADRESPVVKRIALRRGDRVTDLAPGIVVPSGPAEVLVEAYDVRGDVRYLWPLAPYAVRLVLNGAEVARFAFEALEVREGRMVLLGTVLAALDVYATDRLLRLGTVDLRGGESHLIAVVRDFAGNEAAREVFFTVRVVDAGRRADRARGLRAVRRARRGTALRGRGTGGHAVRLRALPALWPGVPGPAPRSRGPPPSLRRDLFRL